MSKKQTLNADVEFDEVDNKYLPADTQFDEVDNSEIGAKKKSTLAKWFARLWRSFTAACRVFAAEWHKQ